MRATPPQNAVQELVDRIVSLFDPQRVILFGSCARESFSKGSDVDLLVVMEVNESKRATAMEIDRALADREIPLDLVILTPEEYEGQRRMVGSIAKPAAEEGRVVYERVA